LLPLIGIENRMFSVLKNELSLSDIFDLPKLDVLPSAFSRVPL
jgi:hypothetical protein